MTSGVLFLHSGLILTRRGCDSAYSAPVAFPPQPGLYSMAHSKTSILQGLLLSSLLHLTLSHDGGKSLAQGEGLDEGRKMDLFLSRDEACGASKTL